MASATVQLDEKSLILERIAELELPPGVKCKRVQLGSEWTGEPAWFIFLSMSKSLPYTKACFAAFSRMQSLLVESIIALNLGRWPFIRIVEAK